MKLQGQWASGKLQEEDRVMKEQITAEETGGTEQNHSGESF
jgi:hypothetical protein